MAVLSLLPIYVFDASFSPYTQMPDSVGFKNWTRTRATCRLNSNLLQNGCLERFSQTFIFTHLQKNPKFKNWIENKISLLQFDLPYTERKLPVVKFYHIFCKYIHAEIFLWFRVGPGLTNSGMVCNTEPALSST